jgi:hypothetical protein
MAIVYSRTGLRTASSLQGRPLSSALEEVAQCARVRGASICPDLGADGSTNHPLVTIVNVDSHIFMFSSYYGYLPGVIT